MRTERREVKAWVGDWAREQWDLKWRVMRRELGRLRGVEGVASVRRCVQSVTVRQLASETLAAYGGSTIQMRVRIAVGVPDQVILSPLSPRFLSTFRLGAVDSVHAVSEHRIRRPVMR